MIGPFGNPDGLRTLATALSTAGTDVSTNASSIGGKVDALTATKWTAGASTAFQTHWNGEYTGMVDLGLAGTTMARVLTDLATSLDQANQLAMQAAAQTALTVVTAGAAGGPNAVGLMQQAMQIAQKAWGLATSQLSGVAVPKIGAMTSPQQAAAWAQGAVTPATTLTNLNVLNVNGDPWQKNRRPPFPPFMPPFDPMLSTGGFIVEGPGQTQPELGPFPGSPGIMLAMNAPAAQGKSIGSGGSLSELLAELLKAAAPFAAAAAAGALAAALFANRAKRWQQILVGLGLAGRLLGGAHNGPMTPLEQLLDKLGGTSPPKSTTQDPKGGGNQQGGSGGPPDDQFPPDDGQWHDDGSGGFVKRLPDGSVIRLGP